MVTGHDDLAALADRLERTMHDVDAWSEPPPPLRPFRMPFAMDSMPFEHWLQLVLLPRLREIAKSGAPLPSRSGLAAHAVREFDGRDEMQLLIDVLDAIDETCPPAPTATRRDTRRLGAGIASILLIGAWAVVAIWVGLHIGDAATVLFPATVVQTYTGSIAPDPEFRPLRITISAAVAGDGTLRATDGDFLVLRSLATMGRGPTGPLRFLVTKPPTTAHVVDWLANVGVARGPAAERVATQALAVVTAAVAARSRDALHDGPPGSPVGADPLIEVAPHTPGWVMPLVSVAVLLAGALPITTGLARCGRR
jgi:uncharacterized protein YqcC (DUF446 family)